MVRIPSAERDTTGEWAETSLDRIETPEERGRRKMVTVVMEWEDDMAITPDGGLSWDAIKLAAANPNLSPESIVKYDRNTRGYRKAEQSICLSPRGERGDPGNYERSIELNEARAALREWQGLKGQTA